MNWKLAAFLTAVLSLLFMTWISPLIIR